MALGQHYFTQNSLENTRCRLLLLQAKEDHNATLMLIKMKCKLHHMEHMAGPSGESFQNVTISLPNLGQVSWNQVYAIYTTLNTKLPLMGFHVAYRSCFLSHPWLGPRLPQLGHGPSSRSQTLSPTFQTLPLQTLSILCQTLSTLCQTFQIWLLSFMGC